MNRQRKVVITETYNDLGLIVDVKAEELDSSAQPDIIMCNACKHWTQTTGNMPGFGLGDCDYLNAKLVNCNGYCYWAERREENDQYTGNKLAEGLRAKPG